MYGLEIEIEIDNQQYKFVKNFRKRKKVFISGPATKRKGGGG